TLHIIRIFPIKKNEADIWQGFIQVDSESMEQYSQTKTTFTKQDIALGKNLWEAYQNGDFTKLKVLSQSETHCFEYLGEICQAHIDRYPIDHTVGRPEKILLDIMATHTLHFEEVFSEFSRRAGIYGFGDLQVKGMYNRLLGKK